MIDKEWFKEVYLNYHILTYKVIILIVKDRQVSEDLTQDVFMTFYYNADTINDTSKLKSWLIRTATNKAINHYNRSKRTVILPKDYFEQIENAMSANPSKILDEKELVLELRKVINLLPFNLRVVVVLYYYLEMPQKDIAKILNISLGTVKSRLYYARKIIKEYYQKYEQSEFKGVPNYEK